MPTLKCMYVYFDTKKEGRDSKEIEKEISIYFHAL